MPSAKSKRKRRSSAGPKGSGGAQQRSGSYHPRAVNSRETAAEACPVSRGEVFDQVGQQHRQRRRLELSGPQDERPDEEGGRILPSPSSGAKGAGSGLAVCVQRECLLIGTRLGGNRPFARAELLSARVPRAAPRAVYVTPLRGFGVPRAAGGTRPERAPETSRRNQDVSERPPFGVKWRTPAV